METPRNRRQWLAAALATAALPTAAWAQGPVAAPGPRPYRIYAITFRGMTEVEKGFTEHFASRKIAVQITWRDLNRDLTRMPGFIERALCHGHSPGSNSGRLMPRRSTRCSNRSGSSSCS